MRQLLLRINYRAPLIRIRQKYTIGDYNVVYFKLIPDCSFAYYIWVRTVIQKKIDMSKCISSADKHYNPIVFWIERNYPSCNNVYFGLFLYTINPTEKPFKDCNNSVYFSIGD